MEEDREELEDELADLHAQNLTGSHLQVRRCAFVGIVHEPSLQVQKIVHQLLHAPDQELSISGNLLFVYQHIISSLKTLSSCTANSAVESWQKDTCFS